VAFSDGYVDLLKNNSVTHFQLLLNNLNMIYIASFEKKESGDIDKNQPHQIFLKFFESKKGELVADSFYQAPVSMVTRAKCKEIADEAYEDLKGDESKLATLLKLASFYDIDAEDAKEIVANSRINLTIQAIENKELSISCSR